MSDKAIALSKEQAEKIFKDKQTYIKKSLRKKIAIYKIPKTLSFEWGKQR